MFELTVCEHIASAHYLRNYVGKCANLHGHTWRVEVTVMGEQLNDVGMLIDFVEMKEKLGRLVKELDHVCFNELEYFKTVNPTSENIAKFIYQKLSPELKPCKIKNVCVWESPITCARYYE